MPGQPAGARFAQLIERRIGPGSGFVERPWLAAEVAARLDEPGVTLLLITGGPGAGKTTALSWLTALYPDSLCYFIRDDSRLPLSAGDARSLLFSLGSQLLERRPDLFAAPPVIDVDQSVGRLGPAGRVVGARVEELAVSPFQRVLLQIRQRVEHADGEIVGAEIRRLVLDERLLSLDDLLEQALLAPLRRLAERETEHDEEARLVVIVDGLDEARFRAVSAADGGSIVDWLADLPEVDGRLKLVVASRPDDRLLAPLRQRQGPRLREVVLDPASAQVRADVDRFAAAFLARPEIAGPLTERGVSRLALGAALAERAAGNFQYLAAYERALAAALAQPPPAEALDGLLRLSALPDGLEDLYRYFIAMLRRGVETTSVELETDTGPAWAPAWPALYEPLLGVLAVAAEPVTSRQLAAFAGVPVAARWVDDALDRLAQFLDRDGGRAALFHGSLAEFVATRLLDPVESHRRIVRAARRLAERDGRWFAADPYVEAHLPWHALDAGELARLAADARFLCTADPAALLAALAADDADDSVRSARLLRQAARRMGAAAIPERLAYLRLVALQLGDARLGVQPPAVDLPWRAAWAAWRDATPHRLVIRHPAAVSAVCSGLVDEGRVLATGDAAGGLHATTPSYRQQGPAGGARPSGVSALAIGELAAEILVVCDDDFFAVLSVLAPGHTVVADAADDAGDRARPTVSRPHLGLADGRPVYVGPGGELIDLATFARPPGRAVDIQHTVATVAAAYRGFDPVLVAGGRNGVVRVWDAMAARWDPAPLGDVGSAVTAVASDGWMAAAGTVAGAVHAWDLDGGDGTLLAGGPAAAVVAIAVDGDAVVAAFADGALLAWVDDREPVVLDTGRWTTALAAGYVDERLHVAAGGPDGLLRLWREPLGGRPAAAASGHRGMVTALHVDVADDVPAIVSGGADGTVRSWAVGDLLATTTAPVTAAPARLVVADGVLVTGNADGTVDFLRPATGERLARAEERHGGPVRAVVAARVGGRTLVATAGDDNAVRLWDLADRRLLTGPVVLHRAATTGEIRESPFSYDDGLPAARPGRVLCVALTELDGRPVVASGGLDHAVRVWDAAAHEPLYPALHGHDAPVTVLAAGALDDRPILVSGGNDGALQVWDVLRGVPLGPAFAGTHQYLVTSLLVTALDGRTVAVSGGLEGRVQVWDLVTELAHAGDPGEAPPDRRPWIAAHAGAVTGVLVAPVAGRLVILSGGRDGVVRGWDAGSQAECLTIDCESAVTDLALAGGTLLVCCEGGLVAAELHDLAPRETPSTVETGPGDARMLVGPIGGPRIDPEPMDYRRFHTFAPAPEGRIEDGDDTGPAPVEPPPLRTSGLDRLVAAHEQARSEGDDRWIAGTALNLGAAHAGRGEHAEALPLLRLATAADDAEIRAKAAASLGRVYADQGDLEAARQAFLAAMDDGVCEAALDAAAILGLRLAAAGRLDEAEPYLRRATASRTDVFNTAALNLGRLLEIRGETDAAIALYRRVRPWHRSIVAHTRLRLAELLRMGGETEAAEAAYRDAAGLEHDIPTGDDTRYVAALNLIVMRLETGDRDGARDLAERLLAPDELTGALAELSDLGQEYLGTEDGLETAGHIFAFLLGQGQDAPAGVRTGLAFVRHALGDREDARRLWRDAAGREPGGERSEALLNLAMLHAEDGDAGEALALLEGLQADRSPIIAAHAIFRTLNLTGALAELPARWPALAARLPAESVDETGRLLDDLVAAADPPQHPQPPASA